MKTKLFIIFFLLVVVSTIVGALYCYSTKSLDPIISCNQRCILNLTSDEGYMLGCGRCTNPYDKRCEECDTHLCNGAFRCYKFDGDFGENAINQTVECTKEEGNTCFVEKRFGGEYSRGCGGCAEKLRQEYKYINEMEDKHKMMPLYPWFKLPVNKPKKLRNVSTDYGCFECFNGLCNDKQMEPQLKEKQYCYAGAANGEGEFFVKEECYMHDNDYQYECIKEEVEGFVYKRCGNCKTPIATMPDPLKKAYYFEAAATENSSALPTPLRVRKCIACNETSLCNGAMDKTMAVWLLLLGVAVPIMMLFGPK